MKGSPADFLAVDRLRELELLSAGHLAAKAANIDAEIGSMMPAERQHLRALLAAQVAMFSKAIERLDYFKPEDDIPEFLRKGSTVPLHHELRLTGQAAGEPLALDLPRGRAASPKERR